MVRVAGVTLPLSSIRSRADWGIGQITDMPACADWIRRAGHRLLQILPPHELAAGENSPYGARTAFGLDPIYIGIEAVEDLDSRALDEALGEDGRRELARVRGLPRVDYAAVRTLKRRALRRAFERFQEREWRRGTRRAEALRAFVEREGAWLDDLALYIALRDEHGGWGWSLWPEGERDRHAGALEAARTRLAPRVLEEQYLQWLAHGQWDRARGELRGIGVELMGDLPFVVCSESADVWARAGEFQRHLSLGAPPDAFSPEGQDWGLPPYDLAAMEKDDLGWLRARTRHAARLYDRFRLDHVVGYFRMWVRRPGERGTFDPSDEGAQRERGERVLRAFLQEAGAAQVIGEDLGVIPPFVRASMRALGVPGYKVIPWEREDSGSYRDPQAFPELSVATWSTHDTAPITAWWDEFDDDQRHRLSALAGVPADASAEDRVFRLLRALHGSSSALTLVLAPELLGQRERINTPGTVADVNWTYRLPLPLEDLARDPVVSARMEALRRIAVETGRAG